MYPDIGILRMHRRSDSISTIPDGPNTLTRQYTVTNNAPRYPLHAPLHAAWHTYMITFI